MKSIKSRLVFLALALMAFAVSAGSAFANTAAYTQIVNSAKLTYSGGVPVTASVGVTVALVPSTPNVTIAAGPKVAYVGPNTPAIKDTVTIVATANGPASYSITPTLGATTNTAGASVSAGGAITIGASVTTSGSGANYVTVPAGQIGTNSVNGIGNGSTIVFTVNNNTYTITNVTVASNGDGTYKISWTGQPVPSADQPGPGVLIAEQKTYDLDALPGSVQSAGVDITTSVTATVSTDKAASATTGAALNVWSTTSSNPSVALTKYVRNVTNPMVGSAGSTDITINSVKSTYYTAGVQGKPGDTLEYVIVATNSGSTDLAGSALSDQLPTAFVNMVKGAYGANNNVYYVYYIDPTGTGTALTADTTGQASFNAASTPNLVVNVGTGASSSTTGTIPATKTVTIAYQAAIR